MGVTLRFPYMPHRIVGAPPLSLPAGTTHHWRPVVPVTLIAPHTGRSQLIRRAIADIGSDDTLFPNYMAGALGIPLHGDPTASSVIWHGRAHQIQFGDVELELDDGNSTFHWSARVAFTTAPLNFALLGRIGTLQFFDVTYRGLDQVTVLEPNASFAGTIA